MHIAWYVGGDQNTLLGLFIIPQTQVVKVKCLNSLSHLAYSLVWFFTVGLCVAHTGFEVLEQLVCAAISSQLCFCFVLFFLSVFLTEVFVSVQMLFFRS